MKIWFSYLICSLAVFGFVRSSFAWPGRNKALKVPVASRIAVFKGVYIKAYSAADKHKVYIGDKIHYKVILWVSGGVELQPPKFKDNLKDFSIRDFGVIKRNFLVRHYIDYWYVLDTYTTGKLILPPATIKYKNKNALLWHSLKTKPINIEVESLLKGKENKIRDIKGPRGTSLPPVLAVLIVISIIAISFIAYKVFYQRKKSSAAVPLRSAYEIALAGLDALDKEDMAGGTGMKEYYSSLTNIIRYYIEGRFAIRAPRMTTEEFLFNLNSRKELNAGQKKLLKEFLISADMVKFARYGPDDKEVENSFNIARKFIEQTKESSIMENA